MIVDSSTYMLSFIWVVLASLFRDFLIPLFVWKNYLKDKSYSFRFWFSLISQAALQINLVLLLGFLNICSSFTLIAANLLIYGLIMWNFSDKSFFKRTKDGILGYTLAYKEERLIMYMGQKFKEYSRALFKKVSSLPIWGYLRKNWLEALLLLILSIYNLWFLSHNVMEYHSYQFSDIPVHQSWIYGLEKGNLFVDGIYPFGVHAMVYFIRAIFRINLLEILLYSGAYQTTLMILCLYLMAKEIFKGKYTAMAAVIIFSLMVNQGRYGASLPQEMGMFATVGVAYFLLRYLRKSKEKLPIPGDSKLRAFFRFGPYMTRRYIDIDILMLILCVSLTIAYHFYTAIAAIFLVLALCLGYLPRVLKRQYLIPLLFSAIIGAFLATLPFMACLAKGIPFQESMAWATSVLKGETWHGSDADYQSQLDEFQNGGGDQQVEPGSSPLEEEEKMVVDYSAMSMTQRAKFVFDAMYDFGSIVMFGEGATSLMYFSMALGLIFALMMLLFRSTRNTGHDYLGIIFNITIMSIMGASQNLGIMELVAAARASTFAEPFVGFALMLPVDFIFRLLSIPRNKIYRGAINFLSLGLCALVAYGIFYMGWYHNFFDVNVAYYNEPVYLIRNIVKDYEKDSFTIVSPTEEYYDVVDYGYHTELSEFVNMVEGNQKEFNFPTEYVFFFIEKKVVEDFTYGSAPVSLEHAQKDFIYLANHQDYYFQRLILESKAYYWAQEMLEVYPGDFKVYYEDDIYIAYIMKQNIFHPYELRIDYLPRALNKYAL